MLILKSSYNAKIKCIREEKTSNNLIISISREYGTNGMLNIAFYDKEEIKNFAVGNSLASNLMDEELYSNFLSLDVNKEAIINQSKVINEIALLHDAVIIGRASDYILKNNKNLVKVFIYAPVDYRVQNIIKNYNDSYKDAIKQIKKSDSSRSNYYSVITNKVWGDKSNYNLCIGSQIGNENAAKVIYEFVKKKSRYNLRVIIFYIQLVVLAINILFCSLQLVFL